MNKMKTCNICNIEKNIDEFYAREKTKANGENYIYHYPYCKSCETKKIKERGYDKESRNQKIREWKRIPENKDKLKEYNRKRRENGKEKEWQQNNKDKLREYSKYRTQNKKHEINKDEWENCENYFNYRCAYCNLPIEEHFNLFYGEMKWTDFHKEHVDHIGANDLSNCVPSCKSCNSSKHDFSLEEWYNEENEKFTYERLSKILQWLNSDYKVYIKQSNK